MLSFLAGPQTYDPAATFVICVMLANANGTDDDEDNESGSQFKTKNKHMVRKVLWTACRTFGMQEQYEQYVILLSLPCSED